MNDRKSWLNDLPEQALNIPEFLRYRDVRPHCPYCNDAGVVSSPGGAPWPCQCQKPAPPTPPPPSPAPWHKVADTDTLRAKLIKSERLMRELERAKFLLDYAQKWIAEIERDMRT